MKYMLMILDDERKWHSFSEAEMGAIMAEYRQLVDELKASGCFLGGAQLEPTTSASSVRVRNGRRLITDGPFAETHEHLGGYFLIQAGNLDEAIEIAARIPSARFGTVEVRPIVESPVVTTY
jgi:hypothetical protein